MFAAFIEAVLQDENVDCIFAAIVPHTHTLKTDDSAYHDSDSLSSLLIKLSEKYEKPIVISVNAGSYYQEFTAMLKQSRLPVYGDVRSAIKSLDRFVSYHIKK